MTERDRLELVRDELFSAAARLSSAYGAAVDLPSGDRGRACVYVGHALGTVNRLLADCEAALRGRPGRRFAPPPAASPERAT